MLSFRQAIEAAAVLAGQRDEQDVSAGRRDETSALTRRLAARLSAYTTLADDATTQTDGEQDVTTLQRRTGSAALRILLEIQRSAVEEKQRKTSLSTSAVQDVPVLGNRDLQTLRIVLGIVANWCLAPLVTAYDSAVAMHKSRPGAAPKLQEIGEEERANEVAMKERRKALLDARTALAAALATVDKLLPDDTSATETQERPLARIVLDICSVHILAGHVRLGWGPALQKASQIDAIKQHSTQVVTRILRNAPAHTSMNALSGVSHVGTRNNQPGFVKATTEMLFAAQLLRPDGVMALLRNTFSQDDGNERGLMKKLVSVGQLLSTPPSRMPVEVFARAVAPHLLEVIAKTPDKAMDVAQRHPPSELSTPAQKNAACFALARLAEVASDAVKEVLQEHVYRYICPSHSGQAREGETAVTQQQLTSALELLFEVVSQSEPSSQFVTGLLAPVWVSLFVIYAGDKRLKSVETQPHIRVVDVKGKSAERKLSDLREVAGTLLKTWLRLADAADATAAILLSAREGLFALSSLQSGSLRAATTEDALIPVLTSAKDVSITVEWQRQDRQEHALPSLDNFTLEDLGGIQLSSQDNKASEVEAELTAKLLGSLKLRPSPQVLTEVLQQTKRKDVAASLLIGLLDAYTLTRQKKATGQGASGASDVLYVQHILRLIDVFGADVLQGQLDKVLGFIDFALGGASNGRNPSEKTESVPNDNAEIPFIQPQKDRSALSGLMEVSREEEEKSVDADLQAIEGHETYGEEDEELVETALNLLLALLEGNPKMTTETNSLLKVITRKVKALINAASDAVRPLAKEANLVLSARQSAMALDSSANPELLDATPREKALAKGKAMYQEALMLLQDPILPVRAHGLIVLRELVSFGTTDDSRGALMDPALTVAVLDIFVQAVCDDESFLYLNAVQGLAAMGTTGGHAMVRRLMRIYVSNDRSTVMTQADVDKRLRVGEAMLQVVQKLADALAKYVDDIVGPLLTAVRDASLSTTLRTSMLSIVGTCIEACPQAMIAKGYARDVAEAMIELLGIEVDISRTNQSETSADDALTRDTKLPMLRRAALLLLSLLVRGATMQLQSSMEKREDAAWQDDVPRITALRMPDGVALPSTRQQKTGRGQPDSQPLLFSPALIPRLQNVVGYVAQVDNDVLTRHQAGEVQHDIETLQLFVVQSAAADVAVK